MNNVVMHARSMDEIRPRSNDERRGAWAALYYRGGHHREPCKQTDKAPSNQFKREPALTGKDSI